MNFLVEYLQKQWSPIQFQNEIRRLIGQYNALRDCKLLVYSCPTDKAIPQAMVIREDHYVINDFLHNQNGGTLEVYLETPGGRGDVAEDIVKTFRRKFSKVNFVIAGEAKSAGTIIALSGNDIYMTEMGSLGPIDAQLKIGRMVVSSSAYLEWVRNVKEEAEKNSRLNPFDATIVAQISPGELNGIIHQDQFAQDLVIEWLPKYKFADWNLTETNQKPVTQEMKIERAKEIARDLAANSGKWRFHGRSIKIDDLKEIGLRINRVEDDPKMSEIIYRIHAICRLLFDMQGMYKIFATENNAFFKAAQKGTPPGMRPGIPKGVQANKLDAAQAGFACKCGNEFKFYKRLVENPIIDQELQAQGFKPMPLHDVETCKCGMKHDLRPIKAQLSQMLKQLSRQQ